MKFINKYVAAMLLSTTTAFSFEVNTHQAMTRCALTTQCGQQQGALNLNYFTVSALLDSENYKARPRASFGQYGDDYFHYGEQGEDVFKEFNIKFDSGSSIFDLIEAGAVLEDAIYHNAVLVPGLKKGDGRFNNHFYMAQKDIPNSPLSSSGALALNLLRDTNRSLYADSEFDAFGSRTDNISWALQKDVSVGLLGQRPNEYTIHKAFEYYKKSFDGNAEVRKENQAHLFATMGFIIHLLQDLHSPAHVRNGPHAGGDYLEIYGRYARGFYLEKGQFTNALFDPSIFNAIETIDVNKVMLTDNKYSSYQDFFTKEALWTSENFFSEAHDLDLTETVIETYGQGVELEDDTCRDKNTTIFDKRNDSLSRSQTGTLPIPDAEKHLYSGFDKWFYITNSSANTSTGGQNIVALKEEGWLWDCETMTAVTDGVSNPKSYAAYNREALTNTAKQVMPRAVASSQAFINFFFRARMEAYINYEDANGEKILDTISIKNVSEPLLVSSEELLTFKAGTKLTVSYRTGEDENEIITEIKTVTLPEDLLVDEEFEIEGLKELFASKGVDIQNGDKVLVLLDGQVGDPPSNSLDTYNIGGTGLAVAYATEPKVLIKKTLIGSLNSFDDGYYQKGVFLGYTPYSNVDLVYDRVTKLYWHDPTEAPKLNFQAATDYCNNLNYLNYQWRLPKTREVLSLYDLGLYSYSVFKDDTRKLRTNRSKYVDSLGFGTSVLTLHHSGVLFADDSEEIPTRCVVGIGVGDELVQSVLVRDDTKGIVRDRSTGLIWQDNIDFANSSSPRTYEENLNYCESLSLGGYNDWRLPNENELFSLVGESALDSGVLSPFQTNNTASFFAVSSTPKTENTRSMISVVLGHAQRNWLIRTLPCYGCQYVDPWEGYSRCVR